MDNPYAAPEAPIADVSGDEQVLARPTTRIAAKLLDYATYVLGAMLFLVPAYLAVDGDDPSAFDDLAVGLGFMVTSVIFMINAVMIGTSGQTVGKRLMRIRVVKDSGEPCGFVTGFLVREVVYMIGAGVVGGILSAMTCGAVKMDGIVGLVNLYYLHTVGHRALHDRLANTKVIVA
jgi:uncharacterized RDD family membrane protein YckC